MWVYGDSSKTILSPEGNEVPCGKTGEPWYFLEDMYPAFGNLVPRDIAAREVLRVCELGLGIDGKSQVYLDVSHLDSKQQHKIESVLDIYRKFTGEDPHKVPMKIFPAVHYSMGGAWVDWPAADDPDRWSRYRHMTNIPGCFNVGESEFQYHGANRLGANSLLSCIFAGLVAGGEVPRYLDSLTQSYGNLPIRIFSEAQSIEESFKHELLNRTGNENVHNLHNELSHLMVNNVTVKRDNESLQKTIEGIKQIRERLNHISLDDRAGNLNQTYQFANQFGYMLEMALVITKGALLRDEFRGAHYKPSFPERDDVHWLKTTIAQYDPQKDEPVISYVPVDTRHLKPVARDYSKAKKVKPNLENIPKNIVLPV
jgi:succinate dehydrogenase / fumarate reductase flavoprotein subunit